ncbi:hypothetical protein Tco_1304710 [Tanacetum coccineum]
MVPMTLSIAWMIPSKLMLTTHPHAQKKWEVKSSLRTKGQGILTTPPTPGRRNQTLTRHIPKPSLAYKMDQFSSTPLQDDMIGKINLFWKTVSEKLNDVSTPENAGNSMAPKSISAISHDEREELRNKGIKSPSKFFSPKYLSPTSIKELNKNPSTLKRVYFVNLIVILCKDNDTEEDVSTTNARRRDFGKMTRGNKEVKEQGKEEDEMETNMEVKDVNEEEESEFKTDEEVEEILEEEEEDEDDENFNSFPTMKELSHHEWLLKNRRPPWVMKSIMELYMMNRQHGRMILESVENGPLIWPTIEENGVTRPRKYSELTPVDAIQADCDVKATNIILQGLPPEVYALVSNHQIAKELWERIQLLMQGTSLMKQERECKLYDEFDKFTYKKGETLRDFYLRFLLLLNDMNIYNVKLEQFQVNTKFLNTLPPE